MIKEIFLPEISETVEAGDVIEVFVKVGDSVEVEQPLVQLETEKATFDVPSPVKGQIVEINIEAGQKVKVGQLLMKVETVVTQAAAPPTPKPQEPKPPEKETAAVLPKKVQTPPPPPASPKPAPIASKMEKPAQPAATVSDAPKGHPASAVASKSLPDFSAWGPIERKAITTTRKKIAETLSYTWATVPQVTQYDHADITTLEQFRKQCAPQAEKAGGKITVTSIALKAVAFAMRQFPQFNASFDSEKDEIIYKKYCHLCVAVDTDRGLLVPVIRDVDKKSLLQVAVELTSLAERTKQHKVTPDEMVGGNFTVSNLGGLGGDAFAPIIYWPQAAILGIARAAQHPVYVDGQLQPRLIVPLSLSYDHRIIDGADGIRFLRKIVDFLENPFLLALE
jgi:pyruvate dehydrogenase E2 component (dihydrolipoamide acetyltransferase)